MHGNFGPKKQVRYIDGELMNIIGIFLLLWTTVPLIVFYSKGLFSEISKFLYFQIADC